MEEQRPPWCLRISLVVALSLIAAKALEWSLVDLLTPFLLYPVLALLWAGLLACLVWAIAHVTRQRRFGLRSAVPAVVCIGAALLAGLVPFTDLWIDANFHLLREQREEIVAEVQAGELRPNVSHNPSLISLGDRGPALGPSLSMGGNEIVVEEHGGRKYVFFFTYRGILDSYSGFLFVPEGGDPRLYSDLGEADSTQLVPFDGPWYFASHR